MKDRRAGGSRVRTVFLGSGGFGRESLRRLHDDDAVRLVGVVTAPPRPAGRRQRVADSVIDVLAQELGVTAILRPERLRSTEAVAAVIALEPDLVVLADYGQIVPALLLDLRYGALNLHPSLLPRHRGATPIPATILAGDVETGVTLMRMDAGLDTGPIVAQERVPLDGTATTPQVEDRLEIIAADLLGRSLGPWLRGELTAQPQPMDGVTLTRQSHRQDGRLDPTRPASELQRHVRASPPGPGSFVDTEVGRLVVWDSSVGAVADRAPGVFGPLGLATGVGELFLHEVQPAGGRRMSWEAFLRGHPAIIGSAVVPAP